MEPTFLNFTEVMEIHRSVIEQHGGSLGIRDAGLLQSAIAMPRAGFGGQYLHDNIYAMAAAYLYHIVQNHPFVDGNKRVGLAAAATFLDVNGVDVVADEDEFADLERVMNFGEGATVVSSPRGRCCSPHC